jgi:multiple sugar transport system ATP-binding protein
MAEVALRNIVKTFDRTPAVAGIDLDISDREFVVLVGPSGCGKTTTLRMIAGLEEALGEIYIGDQLVNDVPPKTGHGVPELRALPAHDRTKTCRSVHA